MESIVEFRIADAQCRVVAQEQVACEGASDGSDPEGMRVVGSCSLRGRRYLILCSVAEEELQAEASTGLRALLTPRELQVALLVADGMGNKQIAHRLRLSEWTVSSYIRRIFVKLGVRTRAAMVARMMAER